MVHTRSFPIASLVALLDLCLKKSLRVNKWVMLIFSVPARTPPISDRLCREIFSSRLVNTDSRLLSTKCLPAWVTVHGWRRTWNKQLMRLKDVFHVSEKVEYKLLPTLGGPRIGCPSLVSVPLSGSQNPRRTLGPKYMQGDFRVHFGPICLGPKSPRAPSGAVRLQA